MNRAMPHYLPLPLCGSGMSDVEGLSSYVSRLAYLHGASRHQFIAHLSDWWARHNDQHRPLPKQCASVRLNGYSLDAELFVEALHAATGMSDIRAATLLPLRFVCAKNCIGSTRYHRAWCPRCYQEDRLAGRPAYDRLLWRLQSYERCSAHGLRLETLCPHCGSIQTDPGRPQQLDVCVGCKGDLFGLPSRWQRATRSELGEEDLERLLAYIAQHPHIQFAASAPWVFIEKMKDFFPRGELIRYAGDVFHHRQSPVRPQLNSLLAMAFYFGTPLLDILLDPTGAGSQRLMDIPRQPARRIKKRRAIAQERLDRYRLVLEQAIERGPPYPAQEVLAMRADMPPRARPPSLNQLVKKLHQLRATELKKRRNQMQAQVDQLVLDHARVESSYPRKPFIRKIVCEASAPVHTVRDRVRMLCGKLS